MMYSQYCPGIGCPGCQFPGCPTQQCHPMPFCPPSVQLGTTPTPRFRAPLLSDLGDVTLTVDSTAVNGHALVYNAQRNLWVNSFIDYNTLVNVPTNSNKFAGLSDVTSPTVPNGYVQWNSAGTALVYSTTIPVASVNGLKNVATVGTMGSLVNVSPAGDSLNSTTDVGKVLTWNGTQWTPEVISSGMNIIYATVSLASNNTVIIGPPLQSGIVILAVRVLVNSPDSSAVLTVGDYSNLSKYMTATQNTPSVSGLYKVDLLSIGTAVTEIIVTVTNSAGIVGSNATVLVEYAG